MSKKRTVATAAAETAGQANGPLPLVCFPLGGTVPWATAKRTKVSNPSPSLNQLTVLDLHPAKTYNVRMFAANSVGWSDASNVLTVTTREAGTAESWGDGEAWGWKWGGVGGFCHFLPEALLL